MFHKVAKEGYPNRVQSHLNLAFGSISHFMMGSSTKPCSINVLHKLPERLDAITLPLK